MERIRTLFAIITVLALLGQAVPAGAQACRPIGTIDVDGSNAFRNDERLPRNARSQTLCDGDRVSTGDRTSALIKASGGQVIQTDRNSTIFAKLGSGIRSLLLMLTGGQALIEGSETELTTTHLAATMGSTINLKVDDKGTRLTVIEGRADISSPTQEPVYGGERYWAGYQGTPHKRELTDRELQRTTQWSRQYFRSGAPRWLKWTGGILAAILVGKAIDDHDDDGDKQGWCCVASDDHNVMATTRRECTRKSGAFFGTPEQANAACRPASDSDAPERAPSVPESRTDIPMTWCCVYPDARWVPATECATPHATKADAESECVSRSVR